MSKEEIKIIQDQMLLNHTEMMMEINLLKEKIAPISKIYESAQGFGMVVVWIAKWIITPLIIFGGALLTYKNLKQ